MLAGPIVWIFRDGDVLQRNGVFEWHDVEQPMDGVITTEPFGMFETVITLDD